MRTKREKYPHVGQRLQQIRDELGWTQDDLADKVGSSQMAISYMESGTVGKVMLDALILYCVEQNINASWVISPDNSKIGKYNKDNSNRSELKKVAKQVGKKLADLSEQIEHLNTLVQ